MTNSKVWCLRTALVLLLSCVADVSAAQERVALVIGNAAYKFAPHLDNPTNDANDVSKTLKEIGFDVIEATDVSQQQFIDAVRTFRARLDKAKLALFYYAGHGLQVNGHNYLLPIEAQLSKVSDLSLETVDVQVVLDQMESKQTRVNLVFLDACRENPFMRNLSAAPSSTRSVNVARGLAPVDAAAGTMIAFATQPDNEANDGAGRNSPFAKAFINHIGDPNTDIGLVMRRIRNDVLESTFKRQVPWDHSSLTDTVILVPRDDGGSTAGQMASARPPAPPRPSPAQISDISVADLVRMLNTRYSPIANRRAWRYTKDNVTYVLDYFLGKKITTLGSTRSYVIVQGNAEGGSCHGCGGLIGAFIFADDGDYSHPPKLLVGSPAATTAGSWGLSDSVDLQFTQFGGNNQYGWVIKSAVSAQGYNIEDYVFLLPIGSNFVEAGRLPSMRDNGGACVERSNCYDLKFSLKFDDTNPAAKQYPIILTETGKDSRKQIRAEYRIDFDETRSRYPLPLGLKSDHYNIGD